MLFSLMVTIALLRYGWTWPTFPRSHYWSGFTIATTIHMIVLYFGGLYDREDRLGSRSWLPRTAGLSLIAVGIDFAAATFIDRYLMPRFNLLVLLVVGSLLLTFNRQVARRLLNSRYGKPRVLLVGRPDDIGVAERQLGFSRSEAVITERLTDESKLLETVERTSSTDVLLLTGGSLDSIYPDPLAVLEQHRINVYHRLTTSDTLLGLRRSRQIAGMPFVALRSHALSPSQRRLKRVLDLGAVVLALPILVPVTALIWAITAGGKDGGSLVRRPRVGENGRIFTVYGFASTARLHRWRLDALPQWWSILRGDMSLVGPRHESPEFVDAYEQIIPGYARRHEIPPGAIGLAKVAGGFRADPGVELDHDLHYLVNWSPVLDAQVLVQSAWQLFSSAPDTVDPSRRLPSVATPGSSVGPTVSVALAARNEEAHLRAAVESVLAQRDVNLSEVVLAVAPSTDATADVAAALAADDDRVRVVDNPAGKTPYGFNAAAQACTGDYLALMNAHCAVPDDYLSIGVSVAETTGAANVGGRQQAVGTTVWEQEVAAALNSPIGAGDARHHYDGVPGEIESVPLGIYRRSVWEELGGFDLGLDRNQDYELNWRIRDEGWSIWFDPRLVVDYTPRSSLRALAKQYFDYGRFKQLVTRMWPASFRWHHLAPPVAVLAIVASLVLAAVWSPWWLLVPAAYLALVLGAVVFGSRRPDGRRGGLRAFAAAVTMHMAWGLGILVGARRRRS